MAAPIVSATTRRILYVLLALLLALAGWSLLQRRAPAPEPAPGPRPRIRPSGPKPTPPPILTVPPEKMRDVVAADSLLRPDQRLLLAFGYVASLCAGRASTAGAMLAGRQWEIGIDGSPTSTLSAIPGYVETLDALRSLASGRWKSRRGRPIGRAEAEKLRRLASDPFGEGPVKALESIDRLWGSGADRAALLDLASIAYLSLELQQIDSMEMADLIPGRALALLALSEAASGKRSPEREALLAHLMGYTREARLIASGLPAGTPERLFLEEDDAALQSNAEKASSSPGIRFLFLLRKATFGTLAEVDAWLAEQRPEALDEPPALGIRIRTRNGPFDTDLRLSEALLRSVAGRLSLPEGEWTGGPVSAFERALSALPRRSGPFLDAAARDGRLRALFFSGLHGIAVFYLDHLSSGPAGAEFAAALERDEEGRGAEFQRWLAGLSAFKEGSLPASRLISDLETFPNLGQSAVRRAGRDAYDTLYSDTPGRTIIAEAFARMLDSRPDNAWDFAAVCHGTLWDPMATRAWYRHSPLLRRSELDPGLANSVGDLAGLHEMAADAAGDPWIRIVALEHLLKRGAANGNELRATAREVFGKSNMAAADMAAVRLLYDYGRPEDAETMVRQWLAAHPDAEPLSKALYASRLAHVLGLEGRYPEAWAVIEPHLATWKADALWAGAEVLEGLGRHAEAVQMARDRLDRYPDDHDGRVDLAAILWRQREYDEAARVLADPRHPLPMDVAMETLPRRFYTVFAEAKPRARKKAIYALMNVQMNLSYVLEVAAPFASRGRHDVAIEILDAMFDKDDVTFDPHLRAYRFRKIAIGKEAADEWFRERLDPDVSPSWTASGSFDNREFDLLWLLRDDDEVWLRRAQAAAVQGGGPGPRRDALLAHFRDPKTKPEDALRGLYLLGEVPEARLFELATTAEGRGEVAFVLGVRAAGEKRLEDACAWFRVCSRTSPQGSGSFESAKVFLQKWDTQRFGVPGGADIP